MVAALGLSDSSDAEGGEVEAPAAPETISADAVDAAPLTAAAALDAGPDTAAAAAPRSGVSQAEEQAEEQAEDAGDAAGEGGSGSSGGRSRGRLTAKQRRALRKGKSLQEATAAQSSSPSKAAHKEEVRGRVERDGERVSALG